MTYQQENWNCGRPVALSLFLCLALSPHSKAHFTALKSQEGIQLQPSQPQHAQYPTAKALTHVLVDRLYPTITRKRVLAPRIPEANPKTTTDSLASPGSRRLTQNYLLPPMPAPTMPPPFFYPKYPPYPNIPPPEPIYQDLLALSPPPPPDFSRSDCFSDYSSDSDTDFSDYSDYDSESNFLNSSGCSPPTPLPASSTGAQPSASSSNGPTPKPQNSAGKVVSPAVSLPIKQPNAPLAPGSESINVACWIVSGVYKKRYQDICGFQTQTCAECIYVK